MKYFITILLFCLSLAGFSQPRILLGLKGKLYYDTARTLVVTDPLALTNDTTIGWTGTQGDLLWFSNSTTLSKLAKSTTTGHVLTNGGTNNNPAWGAPFTLTTSGSSGAATFSGGTLNIPQYSGGGGTGWALAGNSITSGVDFLGTTNNASLRVKTNNTERLVLDSAGFFMRFGSISGVAGTAQAQPLYFSGGNTYGDASYPTGNYHHLKWRMYELGADTAQAYGIGMSSAVMEFQTGTNGLFKYYPGHQATASLVIGPNGITSSVDATPGYAFDGGNTFANTKFAAFNNGSAVLGMGAQSGQLRFHLNASGSRFSFLDGAAGTEVVTITGTGKVGIGTSAPGTPVALEIVSTTRGFLNSRMTTTQRDAMSGIATGNTTNQGSGYTNGTFPGTALTGGTGTGAIATITVAGGIVTAVTITTPGSGYLVSDVLSASLAGGTGFTYTILTLLTTVGLEVVNTTQGNSNMHNGRNWTGELVSTSAGTLTLQHGKDYVFTGTTTTWTLPVPSSSIIGRMNMMIIKNRGSGAITLNSHSGNTLYTTAATNTITINAGAAAELMPDGTYFLVMYNL